MKRIGAIIVTLAMVHAMPAAARPPGDTSWGKAGVTLADYKADALACGLKGHNTDVADTEAAAVLKRASSDLRSNEANLVNESAETQLGTVLTSARIVEGARPAKRFREVKAVQLDAVSRCLSERGYIRFRLSEAEAAQLKRLARGSEARRQFLHALASRANVADFAVPVGQAIVLAD